MMLEHLRARNESFTLVCECGCRQSMCAVHNTIAATTLALLSTVVSQSQAAAAGYLALPCLDLT